MIVPTVSSRAARGRVLAVVALLGVALLSLYLIDPSQSSLLPPCPVHLATGLYCPGCGSTRAVHCLLHGDLPGALAKNALMVVSIPSIMLLCLRPKWAYLRPVPWIVLAVIVAYTMLRNLTIFPFVLLAPH
jgi:hypothetical protein